MRTITVTCMDRPELFSRMIDSLCANDLSGWEIFVAVEPSAKAQSFVDICRSRFDGSSCHVTVNAEKLGVRKNPYAVLERAFAAGSDFNLYLEEDLLLSPDAVSLALWFLQNHRSDWLLLNLLAGKCGSAGLLSSSRYRSELFEAKVFNSLGFAARRQEWVEHIEPVWLGSELPEGSPPEPAYWRTHWGWDWSVYGLVAGSPNLKTVQPVFARATHTGAQGTYMNQTLQDRYFSKLKINTRKTRNFRIVDVDDLPQEVAAHIHLMQEITEMRLQSEAFAIENIELRRRLGAFENPAPV